MNKNLSEIRAIRKSKKVRHQSGRSRSKLELYKYEILEHIGQGYNPNDIMKWLKKHKSFTVDASTIFRFVKAIKENINAQL